MAQYLQDPAGLENPAGISNCNENKKAFFTGKNSFRNILNTLFPDKKMVFRLFFLPAFMFISAGAIAQEPSGKKGPGDIEHTLEIQSIQPGREIEKNESPVIKRVTSDTRHKSAGSPAPEMHATDTPGTGKIKPDADIEPVIPTNRKMNRAGIPYTKKVGLESSGKPGAEEYIRQDIPFFEDFTGVPGRQIPAGWTDIPLQDGRVHPSILQLPSHGDITTPSDPILLGGEESYIICSSDDTFNWFDVADPGDINFIAPYPYAPFPQGACFDGDGVLWFTDTDGNIYTIDETTGDFTSVGSAGVGLNTLAYDDITGVLYGATSDHLYTIDMSTGAATSVGPLTGITSLWISMDFDTGGNLYGYDLGAVGSSGLYSVDTSTGACTLIGYTGLNLNFGQDMSYDKENGIMYAAVFNADFWGAQLHTVDLETGAFSLIGPFPQMQYTSFAITYDEVMELLNLTMLDPVGDGTPTPAPGVHQYTENTVVDLTAFPGLGYTFDSWTGDVADPGAARTTITMDDDKTVQATFPEYDVNLLWHQCEYGVTGVNSSVDPGFGSWIHWDDGTNRTRVGLEGAGGWWTSAIRFEPEDLADYHGEEITKAAVYVGENLPQDAVLKIWQGPDGNNLTEHVSQPFKSKERTLIMIDLENTRIIDAGEELWMGVEWYDQGDDFFPAGADGQSDHSGKGDLFREGTYPNPSFEWRMLLDDGIDADWNHYLFIEDENGTVTPIDHEVADNFKNPLIEDIQKIVVHGLAVSNYGFGWMEWTPGETKPFIVRFYDEDIRTEPDWANPMQVQQVEGKIYDAGETWWYQAYRQYKVELDLNSPVELQSGWVSVQMDVGEGGGGMFLWLKAEEGHGTGRAWQRVDGNPGKLLKHDLMLELWGAGDIPSDLELAMLNPDGDGTVSPEPGIYIHDFTSVVNLNALPGLGYTFDGWTGDVEDITAPGAARTNITMYDNYAIEAIFPEYGLNILWHQLEHGNNAAISAVSSESGSWMQWDDGINANAVGLTSEDWWTSAIRFVPEDLEDYNGMEITKVKIYVRDLPVDDAILKIWQGPDGNNLEEHVSLSFEPQAHSWIEIDLPEPYHIIDAGEELYMGVEWNDPGDGYFPSGLDGQSDHPEKGDLVMLGTYPEENWDYLHFHGIFGDWNHHLYVADESVVDYEVADSFNNPLIEDIQIIIVHGLALTYTEKEWTPGATEPFIVRFYEGNDRSEPDWDNPLSVHNVNAKIYNAGESGWGEGYLYYKVELDLNIPVEMQSGWISVQIDAVGGAGGCFYLLEAEGGDGDGQAWHRKNGSSEPLGYDIMTEVWGMGEPLPVELHSFTATCCEERQSVNIEWTTLSETNNSHFNLHRAYDDGNFEKIATIQGAGNSNSPVDYIYTDKPDNAADVIYYKLSQHDFDGKSETFSPVDVICIKEIVHAGKLDLYPNPAKEIINIAARSPVRTGATVEIYNINGIKVFEKELELNEGMNKTEVNVSNFTGGAYVIRVRCAAVTFKPHMIHVKR